MASTENLLWYTGGYKLGHDNSVKLNTFLSYYKWPWYWHEWIDKVIDIPDDPITKPIDPCDLSNYDPIYSIPIKTWNPIRPFKNTTI